MIQEDDLMQDDEIFEEDDSIQEDNIFEEMIKNSPALIKSLSEIVLVWNNIKNKEMMAGKESKELHLKILDFLKECAIEVLKIEELKKREKICNEIYLMRYQFYSHKNNLPESCLSDPLNDIFDEFQIKDFPGKIFEEIENSRKKIIELFIGF